MDDGVYHKPFFYEEHAELTPLFKDLLFNEWLLRKCFFYGFIAEFLEEFKFYAEK